MALRSNTAEAWYEEPGNTARPEIPIHLLPPDSLTRPLWKSLLVNLRDVVNPPKLPPLHLTSRPVNIGLLLGDRLSLPWFRTVFTNIGDVISPESLPPLELESSPADVGELITDQLSHYWWSSLLRNLADRLVPERQAALELTAKPVQNIIPETWMLLPAWSEVISTPKVFYPDKPKTAEVMRSETPRPVPPLASVEQRPRDPMEAGLRRDLRRSRIRQRIWIAMAAAQAIYLIAIAFWPR